MDTELVDKLVLQLNRIFPQILSDKEAHRVTTDNMTQSQCTQHHVLTQQCFTSACVSLQFRNLSVPTKVRLAELLNHLHRKGEEACDEFYRGLHIHAEDIYASLPTRVSQRGKTEWEQGFSGVSAVRGKKW